MTDTPSRNHVLRDYEQRKFALAGLVRRATLRTSHLPDAAARVRDYFARLAEDRFNLAVMGQFNRGKTSLLNAILGVDRLPTGIVPLTSVITSISYGTSEDVVLRSHRHLLTKEIPVDDLAAYVTEEGNPGNVRQIAEAEIQFPVALLRRGFRFIDTPGLGSAIEQNARTTEAFLPSADAFLIVTGYDSPLTDQELRLVALARASRRRFFVVINKQDQLSAEARATPLAYVRRQVGLDIDGRPAPVFSLSARDGLRAKIAGDAAGLVESGLAALEAALIDFLVHDKNTEFLLGMCDRAGALIREQAPSDHAASLLGELGTLRDEISRDAARPAMVIPSTIEPDETLAASELAPCRICAAINRAIWDLLCEYQLRLAEDPDEQRRFAEQGGFCAFHTWQYADVASPRGICAAYPALLNRRAVALRGAGAADRSDVMPPVSCVLCGAQGTAESAALASIESELRQSATPDQLADATCLPHFAKLVRRIDDAVLHRELTMRRAAVLERLAEDMQRYALKHDAVRRPLASQQEMNAAGRALLTIAGHRNVRRTDSD